MDTHNMSSRDYGINSAPLSFVRGGSYGLYGTGDIYETGIVGKYWESLVDDATSGARYLFFSSARLDPQYRESKGYGFSIRCVVR